MGPTRKRDVAIGTVLATVVAYLLVILVDCGEQAGAIVQQQHRRQLQCVHPLQGALHQTGAEAGPFGGAGKKLDA